MFTGRWDALVEALVALRKGAGLTQRQLASALHREQNYIGRVETGQRRVDIIELIDWCRACGADPATEIVRLIPQVSPPPVPAKRTGRSKRTI